jgi:hypothetical protein
LLDNIGPRGLSQTGKIPEAEGFCWPLQKCWLWLMPTCEQTELFLFSFLSISAPPLPAPAPRRFLIGSSEPKASGTGFGLAV